MNAIKEKDATVAVAEQAPVTRETILTLEEQIMQIPGAKFGNAYPLKHSFVDGAYVREITMPKGEIVVSKIHKMTHPYFILKGEVSVLTENGVVRIKAPFSGITPAGTKRILYCHEETVWTTVHVTKETDLDKIEDEVIAKSFDEIDGPQIKAFIDAVAIEDNKTILEKGA
jgi:quercetin dioxygenase-like cupin family protein